MAFYTPDGIRHETQEEALEYLKMLITEVPPSDDEEVQGIHKHDWGHFDLQCAPSEDGTLYLELTETMVSSQGDRGYNMLSYSSDNKDKSITERIEDIEKAKRLVSMVGHEVRSLLTELAEDNRYFYDETVHDVVVHYNYQEGYSSYSGIRYTIDGVFEGYIHEEEGEDILQKVLKSVESQFISEVEGELDPTYNVDGYNLSLILANARQFSRKINLTVSDATEKA